jgi:hypothetical protein
MLISKERMRRCLPLASIQSKELPGLDKVKSSKQTLVVLTLDDLKCSKMRQEMCYERITNASEI